MRERSISWQYPGLVLALGLTTLCAACGNGVAPSKPSAGHAGSGGSRATADGGLHSQSEDAGRMSGSADAGSSATGSAGGGGGGGGGDSSNLGSGGSTGGRDGGGAGASGGGGNSGDSGGSGGGGAMGGIDPTMLPTAKGTCPTMSKLDGAAVSFAGQPHTVWSGDPANGPGPLLIYWHLGGGDSMEPISTIQMPQIQRIKDAGGAVVAQLSSTLSGQPTVSYWYSGDIDIADEVVACAIEQQQIDKRRIWTAGYNSGGVQSVSMWYARSGYVAGAISYSGGDFVPGTLQDPSHLPVGVASHGALTKDNLGDLIDYNNSSHQWEMRNPSAFIVDCDDGGGHDMAARTMMAPQAIQMLWDHPFGITPEPYAGGLPASWPSTCVPPPVPTNH